MLTDRSNEPSRRWPNLIVRLGVFLLIISVIIIILLSNLYLTQNYSQVKRSEAERELSLYSGRLISELQRVSVVPLLLSRDTGLISDINTKDFQLTSQRLITFSDEIRVKSITLLERYGRIVASSDRSDLGQNLRGQDFFFNAIRKSGTVFTISDNEKGRRSFFYSRKLESQGKILGVIVVEVGLDNLFTTWSANDATIMVTNSKGIVLLSTDQGFLNQSLETALLSQPTLTVLERAIRATGDWNGSEVDAYIEDQALYRLDTSIPFQGWRLTYLTPFQSVREKVNGVLALGITALALLLALGFYFLSRRATRQSFLFKAESEELRALNDRLSTEITQRERAERNLQVAEASLEQSSKLAALGEMSAAVSHELNQPLAAMRTYLAAAKLLLSRKRSEEALSSFQRIDDLIGRMGTITQQLKSYSRKGSDDLIPVNFINSINTSIAMMAPQLGQQSVEITKSLPEIPVKVLADPVRLEQVIVNLLRNALDAMKGQTERYLQISLTAGEMATLTIQDNGPGIENLDEMFEPFFTTKKPGEGVGLGLAISSSIAKDLDGRLFARNVSPRGAVFEFQLPQIVENNKDLE
ncbi:ATP-binding protein [Amylibacter sp.]|mgnify:FL=1|jgi:two-component system C4-dicarboxylate transport sensor histidine kinase DctB|nr:ATP-binding protein [Amylibacter sp.]MDA9301924.1 ATP-binding protein [Amylibacter sp.]MDB4116811.1 ATP-binding protein [Amylibacter sp.]MDB9785961.1 ATP-binding protein [Amylibacter sp.]MDB9919914.1 ATP-binding protein [Amylibacter sp.]|tara:strand:- start:731 stop:2485 length:1755 start_codon:yes stop_codon:yes gene_type:complete